MGGFRFGADFESEGSRCDAWLYTPVRDGNPPVVVLAHGLAGERSWRLPWFARRFAESGLAVLLFDYRGFGDSEGTRRVVDPGRHVADWQAAVEHVRELDRVGDRVALWGTSLSAGHALVAAAEASVDALSLQVPSLDGRSQAILRIRQGGPRWTAWAALAGTWDLLRAFARRSPSYVPVVGEPGERAVLTTPGVTAGYRELVPPGEEQPNRCSARVLVKVPFYRPIARVEEVDCPALVVQAKDDDVVPDGPIDRLVETIDDVERVRIEMDHFDPYTRERERVADRQASFFRRHLLERSRRARHARPFRFGK